MFPVEHSAFLRALGYAIGHSLWQMPLLWFAYFGAIKIKSLSSSQRYALSVSACLSGMVWFLLTLGYYTAHLSEIVSSTDITPFLLQITESKGGALFIYNSAIATIQSLAPYISCAYLAVLLLLSIRLVNGFNQVKNLRTQGISKPSIDWRLFVKDHAAMLGIAKTVKVYVSEVAASPLTVGFWKPIILIPLASINHLTTQQMEAVLLHELAHIRRHDYMINILLQISEIILFFNPFMRLLLKQARQERENSCDDWVLQFKYNATDYARALLCIEQHSAKSLLALGSNNNNEFELLKRVKRMVAPERESFNYRQQLGLLLLITILSLGFTAIAPHSKKSKPQKELVAKIVSNPLMRSKTNYDLPPTPPLPLQTATGIDLVQRLVNLDEINRAISSKEFEEHCKQLEENAMKYGDEVGKNISLHLEAIEKNADAVAKHVEISSAMAEKMAMMESNAAKFYLMQSFSPNASAELEKIIAPALEQSAKAWASLPKLFKNWDWSNLKTPPPLPPLECEAPKNEKENRRIRIISEQSKAQENLFLKKVLSFGDAHLGHIYIVKREKREDCKPKDAKPNTDDRLAYYAPAPPNGNFSYSMNGGGYDMAWSNHSIENSDDEVEIDGEHWPVAVSQEPCSIATNSVARLINEELLKKELLQAQMHVKQALNASIQLKINELNVEEYEKAIEKLDIKTHKSLRNNSNGQTIVIEVQNR